MRAPSRSAGADSAALPAPERLAAVATVLCAYPPRHRDALDGWLHARRAERLLRRDGEDRCEALLFRDDGGRACWCLYLLPDSDFLAWDDAIAALPACRGGEARSGAWARLRRRWLRRLRGRWQAQILRLQVLADDAGHCILLADRAEPSALGLAHAQRIAAAEGARLRAQADACCCLASRRAARDPAAASA
ncbi:Hemin transport protein [Lysobacter firmicutimachus]|uniref:Hemin transport protein n=1 Tax=Lysobacter firmicutimachus TaxID=1792846 RepID=A0AAU8MVV3_9GAMM